MWKIQGKRIYICLIQDLWVGTQRKVGAGFPFLLCLAGGEVTAPSAVEM